MTKIRQWSIFTAIAVVVVFVAGWMLLIKPKQSNASDLRSQAGDEKSQVAALQQQIAALEAQSKNLPQEQQDLQRFATQVPDSPSEPTLLRQLSAAAVGSGVELITVTPGTPASVSTTNATGATTLAAGSAAAAAAPAGLTELPLSLGVAGTYPNLEMFFQSLEKLPRALMVTGWNMCPVSGSSSSTGTTTGGATCAPPSIPEPSGVTPPLGTLGGTLSALVYYNQPDGTTGTTTLTPSSGSTAPAASSTAPAATTSPAATPAVTK